MPWKSGDSSKIQDCGWHLAEPMGVQPETAAAKRVGKVERRAKEKAKGVIGVLCQNFSMM